MAADTVTFFFFFFFFVGVVMGRAAGGSGGTWRVLRSVGVSAMHMQVMPNDMVAIFDRTDRGPSNLSLPLHLCSSSDCTAHALLYDPAANAVAPLALKTDTWCSSGALLPSGALLQTGGYGSGDRAVRLLPACPSPAACAWSERPASLSTRRWYATDQLLPDGRVLVLGGRRQFSYEFFPPSGGDPAVLFPFLRDTRDGDAENNLYPFLHLLPDGSLFVFANFKAVALDYLRGRVLRNFTALPDGHPRNYPSSGSSVLLPLVLSAAAPPPAEVLVCGGAARGAYRRARRGTFLPALSTCARLLTTDPRATWRMEEMPGGRVMPDMLLLPTGDVILVSGAARGTAGWELARGPVTAPWLYKPDSAAGERFAVLRASEIPRMYHSAAVVDRLGRVLVGGSNPHVGYNFTGVEFPTELRLEAFSPPYLDPAHDRRRPAAVAATAQPRYGEKIAVTFHVAEYDPRGGVRVALLAPSFTTHSLAMNQRMVVLAAAEVRPGGAAEAYRVEAAAPPNANIAPPGYYLLFVVHAGIPSEGVWVNIH